MAFNGTIGLRFPTLPELNKVTGVDTARLLDQARSGRRGQITRGIEGAVVDVVMVAHPRDRHRMQFGRSAVDVGGHIDALLSCTGKRDPRKPVVG